MDKISFSSVSKVRFLLSMRRTSRGCGLGTCCFDRCLLRLNEDARLRHACSYPSHYEKKRPGPSLSKTQATGRITPVTRILSCRGPGRPGTKSNPDKAASRARARVPGPRPGSESGHVLRIESGFRVQVFPRFTPTQSETNFLYHFWH